MLLCAEPKKRSVWLGESNVVYELCILILGFLLGQRRLWNDTMEHRFRCNRPTSYKPLSEISRKDIWIPTWSLHQPWCRQTGATKLSHLALELDWGVNWYVVYACVTLPWSWHSCTDWPLVMYNYVWPFSLRGKVGENSERMAVAILGWDGDFIVAHNCAK